ncbi:site-specific integrase [Cohnella sp. AR92]|uniref:tyrosine-type recombinase/integrase n=1 Tax=Cohnella sp. AR92 TaxID=648716 RepID=UPI000F8E3AC9|nr:site-specific integrase [Cohnella sp. AR92]RUS44900.1 integrase [Cohnella sp. AR92]
MLIQQLQLQEQFSWLDKKLYAAISNEHFQNTDWLSIPDQLLVYVFLHDEPTYGKVRSEGTKSEYLRDLLDFLQFAAGLGGIRQLAPEDMLIYQDNLSSRYANTSFRRRTTVVKQFLRYIYQKNAVNADLTRLMKKVAQPADELVNRDLYENEVETLLEHFRSTDFFMYALLFILLSSGLRINELASAEWKNVYYEPRAGYHFLDVIGKGNKLRSVLLFDDLMPVLFEFRKRRGLGGELDRGSPSPFFPKGNGRAYNSKYLSNAFKEKILETELPLVKHRKDPITPHTCRHYYAARLDHAGSSIDSVRDALGHSSIITTKGYLLKNRQRENHAALKVGRNFIS